MTQIKTLALGLKFLRIVKLDQRTLVIKFYLTLEHIVNLWLDLGNHFFCFGTMTQYPAFWITLTKIIKKVMSPEVLFSLLDNAIAKNISSDIDSSYVMVKC